MKIKFQVSFLTWIQTSQLVETEYLQRFLNCLGMKSDLIFLASVISLFLWVCSHQSYKKTKYIRVDKKGFILYFNDYSLISLLQNIIKLLAKLVYNRIYKILNDNNLIYPLQFGVQQSHSTSHDLINLTEDIKKNFSKGKVGCNIFVNHQNVLYTVDENISLSKIEHYRQRSVAWLDYIVPFFKRKVFLYQWIKF